MANPFRVAYLDLGFSSEQYGLQPTRYGGGGVAARYLKEDPELDIIVFAPREAFDNVGRNERSDRCVYLEPHICAALKAGYPIDRLFTSFPFDLIVHPHTCETINRGTLNVPIVHFCGFDGAAGHPGNDYILLYDDTFTPRFGEHPKYVRIGKPVPEVHHPHPKAPYVFQCSRHDDHMNSLEVARQCRRYGIQGYFAGPIHNGYGLMEEIDGVTTHYLGEIDEATKLGYYRHARLTCLVPTWDPPFNQSIIEAQGQGCPIWTNRRGPFLSRYLQPGVNGFDAAEVNLSIAYQLAFRYEAELSAASWAAARQYDVSVMVTSFKTAFREIATEWTARGLTAR
jgi:hypothetical protein